MHNHALNVAFQCNIKGKRKMEELDGHLQRNTELCSEWKTISF